MSHLVALMAQSEIKGSYHGEGARQKTLIKLRFIKATNIKGGHLQDLSAISLRYFLQAVVSFA
jgi:hypothetical protein